ncbi:MAG TPA: hypothetical protein VD736_03600 [Nitrososphaera sp.]|nr:hypothetical protein [Nitrososphaera sp.]
MGVALLLAGASATLVALFETTDVFFVVFGIVMVSMGLVLSFAALRADGGKPYTHEPVSTYPLSYIEYEIEIYQEKLKERSGNRAFGLVLISMALFILVVSGLFGFFFLWPLTLLGVCCIAGGAILCKQK